MADAGSAAVIGVAAGFEDVVEADEVAFDVGVGVGDGVAYAGLRGHIHYNLGSKLAEKLVDERFVGDAPFHEPPRCLGMRSGGLADLGEAELLDGDVVIVVEVVDAEDADVGEVAQEAQYEVGANESGGAGD